MPKVSLAHGNGGAAGQELLGDLFLKYLSSPVLHCLEDSALLEEHTGRLAFSTDCYTIEPPFFPGGNIGTLAVHGTINNLAMRGAMPLALSLGVIIEEGFPLRDLEEIIRSVALATELAEVAVVAGDTKVVPRGRIRGICLNTSGIGLVSPGAEVSATGIEDGDAIIVSGNIGEHGLALRHQGGALPSCCISEIAPMHFMIRELMENFPDALHALRDPTRGGLATSLVWLASASAVCMDIDGQAIPICEGVHSFCAQENLNPLYLASEGRCILCCDPKHAVEILALMRTMPLGANACMIGRVSASPMGRVRLRGADGSVNFLDAL